MIAQSVARTLVMYGGTVVESSPTRAVLAQWLHPYTQGLFAARPRLGTAAWLASACRPSPAACPIWPTCPRAAQFAGRRLRTLDSLPRRPAPRPWPSGAGHEARCIRLGIQRAPQNQ